MNGGTMGGGASGHLASPPTSPLQPPAPPTAAALREIQKRKRVASEDTDQLVDCYPYAFSPLLLFAPSAYFDRGYSNYHAVAQFFSGVLEAVSYTHLTLPTICSV